MSPRRSLRIAKHIQLFEPPNERLGVFRLGRQNSFHYRLVQLSSRRVLPSEPRVDSGFIEMRVLIWCTAFPCCIN